MQKIVVAGGTGLVGSNLITKLKQKNFQVVLLTTQKYKADNRDIFYWHPDKDVLPIEALTDADICINLCGAAIFEKRFTDDRKKELRDSRIKPGDLLLRTFKNNNIRLKHYISSSATGFYPNICSEILTENSTKGSGFIAGLVEEWEQSAQQFEAIGTTVSIIRTGIVFSQKGGFLEQLAMPVKYFVGAVPASGKQIISWIHIDDLSDLIIYLFEHGIDGTFNATGSKPETLEKITQQIAKAVKRPLLLPNIPEFALEILFGERYKLLLTSQHVSNEKIKKAGFKFQYETSSQAIENLLNP